MSSVFKRVIGWIIIYGWLDVSIMAFKRVDFITSSLTAAAIILLFVSIFYAVNWIFE